MSSESSLSTEEKEEIKSTVLMLFNEVFEMRLVSSDSSITTTKRAFLLDEIAEENVGEGKELSMEDLKITKLWGDNHNKLGHMKEPAHTDSNKYCYGINYSSWGRLNDNEKLASIIHETAHMVRERPVHKEDFWLRGAKAINTIINNIGDFSEEVGIDIKPWIVKDRFLDSIREADSSEMDKDRSVIFGRIAKTLNYPENAVGDMGKPRISFTVDKDNYDEEIPISDITIPKYRTYTNGFVWPRIVRLSPQGKFPREKIEIPYAVEVEKTDSGYRCIDTTTRINLAIVTKRIWDHRRQIYYDGPPKLPVTIK